MTKFLRHTTEWIGRTTIFCNDKIPQIYYRTDWQDYFIMVPQIYHRMDYHILLWQNFSNILPNRLVGLPYFVMTTFLKYTTEWIGRTAIFCNDKITQTYYRMDWQDYHILLWPNFTNILPNRLVGLPYFIMTKFL